MADLIPEDAKLVAHLGLGIDLLDVSHLLPTGPKKWSGRRPGGLESVRHLFAHHSGALGRPGFDGLFRSARFVTRSRNFPTVAYAWWLPMEDVRGPDGRRVMFQALHPETRGWHTGRKANDTGEAVCFQGNTSKHGVSKHQEECWEAFVPYWALTRGRSMVEARAWLGWHAIGNRWGGRAKKACPGRNAERFVRDYVERASMPEAA